MAKTDHLGSESTKLVAICHCHWHPTRLYALSLFAAQAAAVGRNIEVGTPREAQIVGKGRRRILYERSHVYHLTQVLSSTVGHTENARENSTNAVGMDSFNSGSNIRRMHFGQRHEQDILPVHRRNVK